ncbi:hypothetical protein ES702_05757 [subsurface metagenome]
MLVLYEWNEKRKGKAMMEEIITLIIHEASDREGDNAALKLKEVLGEVSIIIGTMASDLVAIKQMEIGDDTKKQMAALVLTSHKA